ncbi:MAG: tripeptidyl-peptidase Serine peptidase family [Marmoricola sp.]|nr:tripeptidyl-peptidase Serine peptidase family [Marmoricola sp.]
MSQLPPLPSVQPRGPRPRRPLIVLALVIVLVLGAGGAAGWLLLGDGDDAVGPPAVKDVATMPATDPALARFYDQKLAWKSCDKFDCATMTVPVDYGDPSGATTSIAVLKVPAAKKSARIGSLVVNPGGPGGSGVDFAKSGASQFGKPLARVYDIVGFDPRGVGRSDPLDCADTAQLDALIASDPDPDTAAEVAASDRLVADVGRGCLKRTGELARHMSTKEAARDMDVLRALLGSPKLDYLGSSYGTFLGATYAEEFPTNVGRFVLDGAIDPALSNTDLALGQARGFETALRAYVADCVAGGACVLGTSVDAGTKRVRAFLDELDAQPLPTGTSRPLTEGLGMSGVWFPLYLKDFWPYLTAGFQEAFEKRTGSILLQLSDLMNSRGKTSYDDNSIEVLYNVNCLDHDDSVPPAEIPSYVPRFLKASPTFGRTFAAGLASCGSWPIRSGQRTVALHAKGAPPIVVIGTTRDPATPLVWAQGLAAELDSGTLITRDGDGHTGFQQGSACVDRAVESWLISKNAPPADLKC